MHPGPGDEESRTTDPSGWRVRRTDYEFPTSRRAPELLLEEGIVVIDDAGIQRAWTGAARRGSAQET